MTTKKHTSPATEKRRFKRRPKKMDSRLLAAARNYESNIVIPHCNICSRPCCQLTDVVLELSWYQTRSLYSIDSGQKEFDQAQRGNRGLDCIRKQEGMYYAYGSPCPAYDQQTRLCKVYQTDIKPESCSDFPVYLDEDVITADTRCEAVNIKDLLEELRTAAPDLTIAAKADLEFPKIFTIHQKKL